MGTHSKRGKHRSYGGFKLPEVLEKFHITWVTQDNDPERYQSLIQEFHRQKTFIPYEFFAPSYGFEKYFVLGRTEFLETFGPSERLRKSWLIWPFLVEMQHRHPKLKIWEEVTLSVDPLKGLTCEPDYVVTMRSDRIKPPYRIIMEAKQLDFSQGWGHALTAMKSAQILNRQELGENIPIYGVVSTGDLWQFGKLQGKTEEKDSFIMLPDTVMNVLEADEKMKQVLIFLDIIFEECEKNGVESNETSIHDKIDRVMGEILTLLNPRIIAARIEEARDEKEMQEWRKKTEELTKKMAADLAEYEGKNGLI